MTIQEMSDIQRYLKETQPNLRGGSHDWWEAFRKEKLRKERNEGKKGTTSSTGSNQEL